MYYYGWIVFLFRKSTQMYHTNMRHMYAQNDPELL